MPTLKYAENELGLIIAEGDDETDAEPCLNCRHALVAHTGIPGILDEFAMLTDCDECDCRRFVHSQKLYTLDPCAAANALR